MSLSRSEILYLSRSDLVDLDLSMKETLKIVESVFHAHGEGNVMMPAKITLHFASGRGDANAMGESCRSRLERAHQDLHEPCLVGGSKTQPRESFGASGS